MDINVVLQNMMLDVEASLECPVCLTIPRQAPVSSCCSGHIICQPCRKKVSSCPTCRVSYNSKKVTTNSLASSLIETVLHKCKFSQYQCDVKLKLKEIIIHEMHCPERTLKCPGVACREIVQLKKFEKHAREKLCSSDIRLDIDDKFGYTVSKNYLKWDGISKIKHDELEPSKSQNFTFAKMSFFNRNFYCFLNYQADKRHFIISVFLAEDPEVAANYKVKISIFNKDSSRRITYESDVFPIEEVPSPREEVSKLLRTCWCIPYDAIRQYLWTKRNSNNRSWNVSLYMNVQIYEKIKNPYSII